MISKFYVGDRKLPYKLDCQPVLPDRVEFLFWPPEALEGADLVLSDPDARPAMTVT